MEVLPLLRKDVVPDDATRTQVLQVLVPLLCVASRHTVSSEGPTRKLIRGFNAAMCPLLLPSRALWEWNLLTSVAELLLLPTFPGTILSVLERGLTLPEGHPLWKDDGPALIKSLKVLLQGISNRHPPGIAAADPESSG